MTHATVSVLTLVSGRENHLRNLMLGLARQSVKPDELVVGVMQDDPPQNLPQLECPVRLIPVSGDGLPLAKARNAVARQSRGALLTFLDVDCIPAPDFLADYLRHSRHAQGVFMGDVLYLPKGAAATGWDYDGLEDAAERHVDRPGPPDTGLRACEDYRCFWSLNFAMRREDWVASGGFDERFTGYGGEDTDFGKAVTTSGLPLWWTSGARAYHQYHPHCMPPIHHIPSILRNAELFAEKWGYRTMEHWLHAFKMMGLVEETPTGLRQIRPPSRADYALCRQQEDMPFASSGRVIKILRKQHGDGEQNIAAE